MTDAAGRIGVGRSRETNDPPEGSLLTIDIGLVAAPSTRSRQTETKRVSATNNPWVPPGSRSPTASEMQKVVPSRSVVVDASFPPVNGSPAKVHASTMLDSLRLVFLDDASIQIDVLRDHSRDGEVALDHDPAAASVDLVQPPVRVH